MPPPSLNSVPPKGMARVASLAAIPALLREFGVAPEPLLDAHGISEAQFMNPEGLIEFATAGALLAACVQVTGCPHFGLLAGQRGNVATLGIIGFMMRNAPDVLTALDELIANYDLHDRGAQLHLTASDSVAIVEYELYENGIAGAEQIYDLAMATAFNVLRSLCGPAWEPQELRLRQRTPADLEPYRQLFGCPLIFEAGHNAITFSSNWLDMGVFQPEPWLYGHFSRQVELIRENSVDGLIARINAALLRQLGSDRCTLEGIADEFHMHPRTLNRRLLDAGTSFRELHRQIRHRMACQLLSETRSSIMTIATLLGYSGTTAFNRAFSEWEGTPPASWRKSLVAGKAEPVRRQTCA